MNQEMIESVIGGSPRQIAAELSEFSKSARTLSSSRDRLIEKHEKSWIGLYRGKVEIIGDTIDSVISQLTDKGLDPDEAIIRYIDRDLKTLIL